LQQTPTGRTGPRRSRPCDSHHRALRSSPTRRSSDLKTAAPAPDPAAQNRAAAKPAKAARGKAKTPEVTVTLSGTADGEWTVEVVTGKKRSVRGLPVSSGAVAQAAKLLHPEVEEVVNGVLEAVREAQLAKVAQLQAELEAAKRALEELDA